MEKLADEDEGESNNIKSFNGLSNNTKEELTYRVTPTLADKHKEQKRETR